MKKLVKWFRRSRTVRYIKDLSIVIIGVFVSLYLSNYIVNRTKQNEVKEAIALIKTELRENLESVKNVQQEYETEQRISHLIRQRISKLEEIPADTLSEHAYIIGRIYSIHNEKGSYEVFKSSGLTPYVKDKDFLKRLAKAYDNLETLNDQLERYANMKAGGLNEMLANINEKELEQWSNGSIYDFFRIPLSYKAYRSFFYVGGTIIDPALFERCRQTIISTIEEIEGNYPE